MADTELTRTQIADALDEFGLNEKSTPEEISERINQAQNGRNIDPDVKDALLAQASLDSLNASNFGEIVTKLAENSELSEDKVRDILGKLGLTPNTSPQTILDRLKAIENKGEVDGSTQKVLDALQRIPEAGLLLAPFKHPMVSRFLRGSAVVGGAFFWPSITGRWNHWAPSGLGKGGNIMPRTGNSIADTAAYFVPFAGNLYDFEEAWGNLKQGNVKWALFNAATGTIGMGLDVFSVLTAPTGVGPVAGQSARIALKTGVKSLKAGIRSGAIGRVARNAVEGVGRGRDKLLQSPDKWINKLEIGAQQNLQAFKEAGFLGKIGNGLAYAGKETLTGVYNIGSFKWFGKPSNVNASVDAARAADQDAANPNKAEVNDSSYKIGQVIKIEGPDGTKNVKIEGITPGKDGSFAFTGKDIETNETVEFDSQSPIRTETAKERQERLKVEVSQRMQKAREQYGSLKNHVESFKTRIKGYVNDIKKLFPLPKPKPRKPKALDPSKPRHTKMPSDYFSNRGAVSHLRTNKMENDTEFLVERTGEQTIQLTNSNGKSAGIRLHGENGGYRVEYLPTYKGDKTVKHVTAEKPGEFKVDDSTEITIKVEETETGMRSYFKRENV